METTVYKKLLPSLKFIIVETVVTQDEEVVLLVALASLALHVPVVLASHLVLILLQQN